MSLSTKAGWSFRVAAAGFFAGLLLMLIPKGDASLWRLISLSVVAVGLVLFLLTSFPLGSAVLGRILLAPEFYRELPTVEALTDDDIDSVALDHEAAARMKAQSLKHENP